MSIDQLPVVKLVKYLPPARDKRKGTAVALKPVKSTVFTTISFHERSGVKVEGVTKFCRSCRLETMVLVADVSVSDHNPT